MDYGKYAWRFPYDKFYNENDIVTFLRENAKALYLVEPLLISNKFAMHELTKQAEAETSAEWKKTFPYTTAYKESASINRDGRRLKMEITEIDDKNANLSMLIALETEFRRHKQLQGRLERFCSEQSPDVVPYSELRKGLSCAVSFFGKSDYHRAVVMSKHMCERLITFF